MAVRRTDGEGAPIQCDPVTPLRPIGTYRIYISHPSDISRTKCISRPTGTSLSNVTCHTTPLHSYLLPITFIRRGWRLPTSRPIKSVWDGTCRHPALLNPSETPFRLLRKRFMPKALHSFMCETHLIKKTTPYGVVLNFIQLLHQIKVVVEQIRVRSAARYFFARMAKSRRQYFVY